MVDRLRLAGARVVAIDLLLVEEGAGDRLLGASLSALAPNARAVLPHAEPLRLTATGEGVTLIAPAQRIVEIGHLDGWGSGLHGGPSTFAPWTRGNGHERFVTLLVQGSGTVRVQVGSCRVGQLELSLPVN